MIIFTHIARTSGKMIEDNIIPPGIKQKRKAHKILMRIGIDGQYSLKEFDAITGHVPFGIHKYIKTNNMGKISYFTFIREPISRWASEFNHSIKFKDFVKPIWDSCKNTIEFLERCIEEERNTNIMTKQMSGLERFDNVIQDYKNYMYMWASRKYKYSSKDMNLFLQESIFNIDNNYDFVGVTGKKSSYIKLCKKYKWRIIKNKKTNTSTKSLLIDWKDKKVTRLLYKINEYDVILYKKIMESM